MLPHALDVLKFVRSRFDFVFVSSGVPLEEIRYLVKLNGLPDYFDLVLGTNEKYLSKRDHFKEILQTKKPSLFIFMRDSAEDVIIANQFNAISISLPTNQGEEVLKKTGAKFICSLEESIPIIKKLL